MTSYDDTLGEQTAPVPAVVAVRHKRRQRRRSRFGGCLTWLAVLVVLVALTGTLAVLGVLLGERQVAGRIYPNISVRGLDLSTYGPQTAQLALQRRYNAFLTEPVEITFGDQRWNPTAEELGIRLDFDRALAEALAAGRHGDRVEKVRTVGAIWERGVDIPLHASIDEAAIQRYVLRVAAQLEQAPRNADIALVGTQVAIAPDHDGIQVLVDETVRDIVASLQSLSPQQVTLRTRTLAPRIRASAFDQIASEIQTLFAGPVVMTTGKQQWTWTPEQIAQWVRLRRDTGPDGLPQVSVVVNQEPIRNELAPIATELRQQGKLPRVDWNDGQLRIIEPGTADYGLNGALALTRFNQALRGTTRSFEAPFVELPPAVDATNLASLGITGPIASGVSSFKASQAYRITNIRAGARQMNGILIPPGGTFSFNDNLGAVDASNGFVQGSAIVDNRTQKEWGGGLCQVSTTVFRAAFWGGLPIVERHEHAFRIGWYEELGEAPGLDAAIFTPYNDMRFTNDTGSWILVQSYVDLQRQRLTVTLYGKPTGREVAMDYRVLGTTPAPSKAVYVNDPTLPRGTLKKTDFARPGLKVEVYRTVRVNGAVFSNDTFPTEFKPWPNIFVRGGR